jgi:hypothetical protein
MTFSIKQNLFVCAGLLCGAVMPVAAQNYPPAQGAVTSPSAPLPEAPSITAHLQMPAEQIYQLNRLYDDYVARRMKHEANLAQWQNQLRHSPAYYEHGQVARLERNIYEVRQKVSRDFLSTREKALKVLTPVQRAQLEALSRDARIRVRGDRYHQLLLLPVEQLWQVRLDNGFESPIYPEHRYDGRHPRDYGHGNYGVYGGYSYGHPQYGVYGSYGQSSVGVHAGIGRGGPSFGIGIGRIFGGWVHR